MDKGVDFKVKGFNGRNLLHCASYGGNLVLVKKLVGIGLSIHSGDDDNSTPMHYTAIQGHSNIIEFLNIQGTDINFIDGDGKSPLDYASEGDHTDCVELIKRLNRRN